MFLSLLKNYGWYIAIVLLVFSIIGIQSLKIDSLKKENMILQGRVKENQAYILTQNMIIKSNRADYEIAINRLPTVLHDINTKYKTQYETIYAWRESNTSNDCNASINYINTFRF